MEKVPRSIFWLLFVIGLHLPCSLSASVEYDERIPEVAFAAQELKAALRESGRKDLKVALAPRRIGALPESPQIRLISSVEAWVAGADATGTIYGGLEGADRLRLGLPIEAREYAPFVEKRGIRLNIPFDVRTPSYDDSGDSPENNIETVWDFKAWEAFFEDMARDRCNVLSLWSAHPYPSIVKLDDYPDAALEDVYRMGLPRDPDWRKSGNPGPWGRDLNDPGIMKLDMTSEQLNLLSTAAPIGRN